MRNNIRYALETAATLAIFGGITVLGLKVSKEREEQERQQFEEMKITYTEKDWREYRRSESVKAWVKSCSNLATAHPDNISRWQISDLNNVSDRQIEDLADLGLELVVEAVPKRYDDPDTRFDLRYTIKDNSKLNNKIPDRISATVKRMYRTGWTGENPQNLLRRCGFGNIVRHSANGF
jgi:hypothetical protein